jgi:hypothetical protein
MDRKPRKKPAAKRAVWPTPPAVLCRCGHPVCSRHFDVWDTEVTPEGELFFDGTHNDEAADQMERGLYCSNCKDFIRDEEGEPYEYPDVPLLLATGILKLANTMLPEAEDLGATLFEGAVCRVVVNAYERNPVARRRCLAHNGATCLVCGFNFGAVYGELAEGFIHVHHVKRLSEIGEQYEVDPVADLRPVCPNCHAVFHLGGECRGIEEVKRMLDAARMK